MITFGENKLTNITVNDQQIDLFEQFYLYTKNGTFKRCSTEADAVKRAYSQGDGSGNVYVMNEYFTFDEKSKEVNVIEVIKLPTSDTGFSGKAATRRGGALYGCQHPKTSTVIQKNFPYHYDTTELVTCDVCLNLLSRISYHHVQGTEQVNTTTHYVGWEPPCSESFTVLDNFIKSDETINIKGVDAPLVYVKYLVRNPDETNVVVSTEAEAQRYALELGDGTLEYLVTKLYHYITPELSYEVEISEVHFAEGEMSEEVQELNEKFVFANNCKHTVLVPHEYFTEGDNPTLEFTEYICEACDRPVKARYFQDSCQPQYTAELLTKTPEQEACAHTSTVNKETPSGWLSCIVWDTAETVYCADCDALLYCELTGMADDIASVIHFRSQIAATFQF